MKQIDQYIIWQFIRPFLFFISVFICIVWINHTLRLTDIIANDGQSLSVFFIISLYLLPNVIEISIIFAGFASAIIVTNRLLQESEITVMMAVGRSLLSLAYPFVVFGFICAIISGICIHFLTPWAKQEFRKLYQHLKSQYVTKIIQEGEFITVKNDYTFFFGEKNTDGTLGDIIIFQKISDEQSFTYTAQKGRIITQDGESILFLLNGKILDHSKKMNQLNVVQFASFNFNLSQFNDAQAHREPKVNELSTLELYKKYRLDRLSSSSMGKIYYLFNQRLVDQLLVIFVPVFGMSVLLIGGYQRSSIFIRIACAIILMLAINALYGFIKSKVSQNDLAIFFIYIPVILTLMLTRLFLALGLSNFYTFKKRFLLL